MLIDSKHVMLFVPAPESSESEASQAGRSVEACVCGQSLICRWVYCVSGYKVCVRGRVRSRTKRLLRTTKSEMRKRTVSSHESEFLMLTRLPHAAPESAISSCGDIRCTTQLTTGCALRTTVKMDVCVTHSNDVCLTCFCYC